VPSFKNINLVFDTKSDLLQFQFRIEDNGDNDEKLNDMHSKLGIVIQHVINDKPESILNWKELNNIQEFKQRLNEINFENDKQKGKYQLPINPNFIGNNHRYIHVRAKLISLEDDNNSNSGEWCKELFYLFEPDIVVNLQFENEQLQKVKLKEITVENLRTYVMKNFNCNLTANDVLTIDIVSLYDKNDVKMLDVQDDNFLLQLQNIDKLLFRAAIKPHIQIPDKIKLTCQYKAQKKQFVLKADENQYNLKAFKSMIQNKFTLKNDVLIFTDETTITKDEQILQFFKANTVNTFSIEEVE